MTAWLLTLWMFLPTGKAAKLSEVPHIVTCDECREMGRRLNAPEGVWTCIPEETKP